MTPRPDFHPLQAEEIARAFQTTGVEYLFIRTATSKATLKVKLRGACAVAKVRGW